MVRTIALGTASLLFSTVLLAVPPEKSVSASAPAGKSAPAAAPSNQITGELVDTKCFIEHGARGEKHRKCASACAKDGTPVGILTADGTYYVVAIQAAFFEPYMASEARFTGKIDAKARVVVPTKFEVQRDGAWTEVKLPEQIM